MKIARNIASITQRKGVIRRARGLSLVEASLGLMLGIALLTGLAMYQGQANKDIKAKNTAESMQSFTQMAAQYLISNREEIRTAISGENPAEADEMADKHCIIGADAAGQGGSRAVNRNPGKMTCAVDVTWLKYKRVLPQSYPELNAYGQKWVAIFREVYADYDDDPVTPDTTNGDMEILVVATGGRSADANEILMTADLMGGNGGVIPDGRLGSCEYDESDPNKQKACGVGGGWKVDLRDFIN